jgi:hypothetical protein
MRDLDNPALLLKVKIEAERDSAPGHATLVLTLVFYRLAMAPARSWRVYAVHRPSPEVAGKKTTGFGRTADRRLDR